MHHSLPQILVLFLRELTARLTLKFLDTDTLDVCTVNNVGHVRVVRIAVQEERRVNVLRSNAVVRVILALDYSHTAHNQVFYSSAVNVLVELVPVQGESCSQLRCNLSVGLHVLVHENLSLLRSIWKHVGVNLRLQPHSLRFHQQVFVHDGRLYFGDSPILLPLAYWVDGLH